MNFKIQNFSTLVTYHLVTKNMLIFLFAPDNNLPSNATKGCKKMKEHPLVYCAAFKKGDLI